MPFAWVLDLIAPLLKKWQTWVLIVLAALVLYILFLRGQLRAANAALAERPKVETKVEIQTKTVKVEGPERIVEKVVAGAVVERVIYKDPITTTTEAEKAYDRTIAPACPAAPRAPWRYAGALVDPLAPTKLVGLRGGVTLYDRLDLGLSFRTQPNVGQIEAGIRF